MVPAKLAREIFVGLATVLTVVGVVGCSSEETPLRFGS